MARASKVRRADRVNYQLTALAQRFAFYLTAFDHSPPFQTYQLEAHRDAIGRRRKFDTVADALDDRGFLAQVRQVLLSWGMGVRGSLLVDEGSFIGALQAARPILVTMEGAAIDDEQLDPRVVAELAGLIKTLAIANNSARLVPVTKALHHILPDLVPPMDREYTMRFFGFHPSEIQYATKRCFERAFDGLRKVAFQVRLERHLDGGWRTSRTKLLDNAVVAYCRVEKIPKPS